jgi:hypothetical protein
MTRKDYIATAETIAQFTRDLDTDALTTTTEKGRAILSGERVAAQTIAHRLADLFARDNARFDRSRFLKACGL